MTALSIERETPGTAALVPARGTYPIAANTRIFKGSQVALDSSGRAIPATTLAGGAVRVVGKASHTLDNRTGSELGGGAGAADLEVEFGVFGWENSGGGDAIADDDAGKACYAVDDQTVALTSDGGARTPAGFISEVGEDGKVYVWQSPAAAKIAESGALADAGVSLQKRTVTVGHADLTDADTSEDENIGAAMAANARILGVTIKLATPFAGITGPVTVDVGSAGDIDALVDGANLTDAAVDGQASTMPLGIAPFKHFSGATQLVARFLSADGNLVDCSAGAVTIDVHFAVLA